MTSNRKISVIIPVKNRAQLIVPTLDNLLAQSLQPYEIIVVDDESTDYLPQVINEYKDRVVFIKNKGKGPGAGRNTGLAIATGDTIQFFDSDDLMTSNKLELQSIALDNSISGMVYSPYFMAYQEENGAWKQKDVVMNYDPFSSKITLRTALIRGWNIITQACLFDTELIKKNKPWNEQLMTHEDYLYLFNLSKFVQMPVHVPGCAVLYRQHNSQLTDSQTKQVEKGQNMLYVLEKMWEEINLFEKKKNVDILILQTRIYECLKYMKSKDIKFEHLNTNRQKLFFAFWRIYQKIGRKLTGSDWQPMHGVNTSKELFSKYLTDIVA